MARLGGALFALVIGLVLLLLVLHLPGVLGHAPRGDGGATALRAEIARLERDLARACAPSDTGGQ